VAVRRLPTAARGGERPAPQCCGGRGSPGRAGFGECTTISLQEVRRRYADREDYLAEIAQRTGRSILHELDDAELGHLVRELRHRLREGSLVETDRWTLWRAVRQP
jgi:hypothetical protein